MASAVVDRIIQMPKESTTGPLRVTYRTSVIPPEFWLAWLVRCAAARAQIDAQAHASVE